MKCWIRQGLSSLAVTDRADLTLRHQRTDWKDQDSARHHQIGSKSKRMKKFFKIWCLHGWGHVKRLDDLQVRRHRGTTRWKVPTVWRKNEWRLLRHEQKLEAGTVVWEEKTVRGDMNRLGWVRFEWSWSGETEEGQWRVCWSLGTKERVEQEATEVRKKREKMMHKVTWIKCSLLKKRRRNWLEYEQLPKNNMKHNNW